MNGLFPGDGGAEFSGEDPPLYRYLLWRRWGAGPTLVYALLNPSIAGAAAEDPTSRICRGRAWRMNCGAMAIFNASPLIETHPDRLWQSQGHARMARPDLAGEEEGRVNLRWIMRLLQGLVPELPRPIHSVIAGWGDDGRHLGVDRAVIELVTANFGLPLYALRATKAGNPCHPLRIPYSEQPFIWRKPHG